MTDHRKAPNEAWFFIFTLLKLRYEIISEIFLSENLILQTENFRLKIHLNLRWLFWKIKPNSKFLIPICSHPFPEIIKGFILMDTEQDDN